MLTLCGFAVSNYFNKVKLILLEKGIPFEEKRVMTKSTDEAVLSCSPLGKIPFVKTEQGALCESEVIAEYLEAAYPQVPLLPADPWEAAKVRELVTFVELHLELVARELYGQAFFGGSLGDASKERVKMQLVKNIAGFKRLARFAPYLAGDQFTLADCSAWASLPLVAMSTKAVFGEDLLAAAGIDWKPYIALVGQRPSAQKVAADRKVAMVCESAVLARAVEGRGFARLIGAEQVGRHRAVERTDDDCPSACAMRTSASTLTVASPSRKRSPAASWASDTNSSAWGEHEMPVGRFRPILLKDSVLRTRLTIAAS